jgi:hypothetical protein
MATETGTAGGADAVADAAALVGAFAPGAP